MVNKLLFFSITVFYLLSCSSNEHDIGDVYSKNFILGYVKAESIKIGVFTTDHNLIFSIEGESFGPNSSLYEYYSKLYNDTSYNNMLIPPSEALIDTIKTIEVLRIDDEDIVNISETLKLRYFTCDPYIKSGYSKEIAQREEKSVELTQIDPNKMVLIRPDYILLEFENGQFFEYSDYEIKITMTSGKELTTRF
ncbi:MAG: hypothetical protein LUF90_06115 [Rikenellaceae bacterium]|nr:hypothetical protein [Rikenellaceae bacterium]